jgi:hypothetical protein
MTRVSHLPKGPDGGQLMDKNDDPRGISQEDGMGRFNVDETDAAPLPHGYMSIRCGIGIAQPDGDVIIDHYQLPA